MRDITLVTSFFNINRGGWVDFRRTAERYLEYFEFWARIQNKLIIYTTSEIACRVLEIRNKYGLLDHTTVHIIDEFREIDPDIYSGIWEAMQYQDSRDFRLLRNVPEAFSADYNYITGLKTWFMADAVKRGEAGDMVSWIDFGYNHGGEVLEFSEDFNFLWTYDFPEKVNIFLVGEIINEPIFETIRRAHNSIGGSVIVCPSNLCKDLWQATKLEIQSLYTCGFADDDQTIMQMVYKKNPNLFHLHSAGWHLPIAVCGGQHMRIKKDKKSNPLKLLLVRAYMGHKRFFRNFGYCVRTFKSLQGRV